MSCELKQGDASDPAAWWDGEPFDRILLDAPCTATGVIRRHPEIKWLRKKDQLAATTNLQAQLLRQLWPLVKPGGMLVYATCSILRAENHLQIRQFLEQQEDAEPAVADADWWVDQQGQQSGQGSGDPETYRQFAPGEQDMDGFFYARLRKKA